MVNGMDLKRSKRKILGLNLAALAILAFWDIAAQDTAASFHFKKRQIHQVEQGPFAKIISTSGTTVAEMSELVKAIYSEIDDIVEKSNLLLKIYNSVSQLNYMQREILRVEQLNYLCNTRFTHQLNQKHLLFWKSVT